ncbi:MAG: class I SAM-dependent DNA methyltransferase [Sterolibacterium sp.]|nr:class I SAM-dependent DNA methyltransferase [Sterolibacterium sp.]
MPLSWNEIKARALAFSRHWADAANEDAEAKPFLIAFFEIFGITDKRIASFEHAVKKYGGSAGFVDLFLPGQLLVEMKSRGKNLDRAYAQAMDYFPGIAERDLPRYVLVCDFARFRLYDLTENLSHEFSLAELHSYVRLFGFIAGYQTQVIKPQDPINIKAAERMGRLHDQLKAVGYVGRPLEMYLVRLLFCLFAEDTSIFERRQFQDYIEQRTGVDGTDLAHHIATLFHVLNTPAGQRLKNLDEQLAAFPYINGKLFADPLPPASFDAPMREALLDLCGLDWSRISPAIFGSLFQSIMDDQARRHLGAHYTSEENILKLIKPLFLDSLWAEFEKIKKNRNKLFEFHKKLRTLKFFDPACGCGNFLVITYRELRLLELEVLRAAYAGGQMALDVHQLIAVDVDQFYGIEIEDFPAQIAQVALWLTDHQMNLRVSEEFGAYFVRIPLTHSATIVHGNALTLDWENVLPAECCSYVLGNPPFVGAKFLSAAQREETRAVFAGIENAGLLDFVAAWYVKAARYMAAQPSLRAAFVSTNSITQGEQVGVLWSWLLAQGIQIHFAHRTFSWTNEARGKAAVHCVIVGFGRGDVAEKIIFEYADIKGVAQAVKAANINPYLVDAPDVVLPRRSKPLCAVPEIGIGNKPIDDGNYLFSTAERDAFIAQEPASAKWFRRWLGADEFLNGFERWCLWLWNCPPTELRAMPEAMKRVQAVKDFRLASKSAPTRKLAETPTRFHVENMPGTSYLLLPRVSSERRSWIPIGFVDRDTFTSDSALMTAGATLYHFGILSSTLHNAWMRTVAGRLESRYRYSVAIVYNNFPWPAPTDKQRKTIEAAAQAVLAARQAEIDRVPATSLADLYDPLSMPAALLKAHQQLDRAVDAAYGYKGAASDAARVAFLFERYQRQVAGT